MIAIARSKTGHNAKNISFEVSGGEKLDFPDESFDWAISSLALHHIPEKNQKAVLGEMYRVLKDGGRMLITDFGPPSGMLGMFIISFLRDHAYMRANLSGSVRKHSQELGGRIKIITQAGVIDHILIHKMR